MMKNIQNSSVLNARKNENRISCTGRQCKRHQRRALRVHIRKKICREEFCSVYNFLDLLAKIDTSTEMTYSIHTNAPTSKSTKKWYWNIILSRFAFALISLFFFDVRFFLSIVFFYIDRTQHIWSMTKLMWVAVAQVDVRLCLLSATKRYTWIWTKFTISFFHIEMKFSVFSVRIHIC